MCNKYGPDAGDAMEPPKLTRKETIAGILIAVVIAVLVASLLAAGLSWIARKTSGYVPAEELTFQDGVNEAYRYMDEEKARKEMPYWKGFRLGLGCHEYGLKPESCAEPL